MAHYKAGAGRWRNGRVPFTVSTAAQRFLRPGALATTINHFRNNSPIRLVPRSRQRDYVQIVLSTRIRNCRSAVGKKGGKQLIQIPLSPFGSTANCLIHEFGHVLGLKHEHQRIDRDDFVIVNLIKADVDGRLGDYKKLRPPYHVPFGPYDRRSLMHYGTNNKIVGRRGAPIGGVRLSAGDVALLNRLY